MPIHEQKLISEGKKSFLARVLHPHNKAQRNNNPRLAANRLYRNKDT
jgi:hypothetical protein